MHLTRLLRINEAAAPAAVEASEDRTVDLVFAVAGSKVQRFDWYSGQRFLEELSFDPAHVRMERLLRGAPLLAIHNGSSLDAVIGVIEKASISARGGTATARFAQTEEAEKAFGMVRDKILRNFSVGYMVHRWQKTDAKDDGGLETWLAIDWEPVEISLVPVPADAGAQVRDQSQSTLGENEMPQSHLRHSPPLNDQQREELHRDEAEIRRLGALTNGPERRAMIFERGMASNLSEAILRELADSDLSFEQVTRRMVDEVARLKTPAQPLNPTRVETMHDNSADAKVAAVRDMSEALIARNDGKPMSERARRYGNVRIVEMARELLELGGHNTARMSRDEILTRSHTTSDLPNLLTSTGTRRLRAAYELAPSMKRIARKSTAPDFRAKSALQFSEAPVYKKFLEGGEIEGGGLSEGKESYALESAGRIVRVSRVAMINDDLDAFLRMTQMLGTQAAEYENKKIVEILTANAAMNDTVALFHANHGNQAAAPTAISDTSLGAAKLAMRIQKGLDGITPINAAPKFLIVPAALEAIALKYLTMLTPAAATNVNPFAGTMELVVDARLDTDSATKWYCAADPDQVEGIEYSHLDDANGPQLSMREEWTTAGIEWRAILDFACKALDWRGLYRNS